MVEIKIPPKLFMLAPDSQRLTWSLWRSFRFIFGLLALKVNHPGFLATRLCGDLFLNNVGTILSLPPLYSRLSGGYCRYCYDVVDPGAFFFMPDFRHPAVFLFTPHPFGFLVWDFFQLCFLDAAGVFTVAKVAVGPAKNIRPVMSAMIAMKVLCIIVQFR
jgi:hypothetical protein